MMRLFISSALAMVATLFTPTAQMTSPELDKPALEFALPNTQGKEIKLSHYKGKFVVLEWTNHECPIVRKHYESGNMQATQTWAKKNGVVWLSIVSSGQGKQGYVDGPAAEAVMKAKGHDITAMLLDPSGKVGKLYAAKTTPHMYVINPKGILIYMGGIDDNQREIAKSRNHVRHALEEALAGKEVSVKAAPPYGCSVKYAD